RPWSCRWILSSCCMTRAKSRIESDSACVGSSCKVSPLSDIDCKPARRLTVLQPSGSLDRGQYHLQAQVNKVHAGYRDGYFAGHDNTLIQHAIQDLADGDALVLLEFAKFRREAVLTGNDVRLRHSRSTPVRRPG